MSETPQSWAAPLWRVALAIGLLLAAGLLIALWPALSALSGAFVAAIEENRWLVGLALLAVLVALLAGAVRAVWAWSWRLDAQARKAAIVDLPGGLPAHVADVRFSDTRWTIADETHFALDRHYAAQLAEAERAMPNLTSFNQHLHIEHAPAPAQLAEETAQGALPQLEAGRGTLAQLHQIGHVCRSGNSLLIGYTDAQPQYIELAECGFVGVGGQPRVGKSSTTLLLINQAVLSGWHVFVGDPHITKADGLLNRCRPLSGKLARQAVTPDEIAAMVRLVDKIGKRRVEGDGDRTPVILVLDEFSNLVWRGLLPADVLAALPSMAAEYAGVGVHGVLIAHDWSKASLGGDLGAALRRAITHRLIHRMDPGNTEFLLPRGSSAQARAVQGLEKGHALAFGPDGTAMIAVPWIVDEDAAYAAQGVPPKPYAPRPQLVASTPARPSAIPPTERVARPPAPPTAPLTITVQEQIISLLIARPWLTSTEIAAALAIDVKLIRTELTPMERRQAIVRRPAQRPLPERYEYAVSQSVNSLLTPSA